MVDSHCTSDPPFIKLLSESGVESTFYHALYEGLPEEFKLKAEKELNESEEKKKQGIQRLKEFTKKQKLDSLDDFLLLSVLRSCKFNLKKSEAKLKKFVAQRKDSIQKLAKLDIAVAERIISDMACGILPYRDNHGRVIVYFLPYGMHFEDYTCEDLTVVILALLLFLLTSRMTTVSGLVSFGECKSTTLYITYMMAKVCKNFIPVGLAYPFRYGKIEILNEFTLTRWFFMVVRPLLPDKLNKRISFNGEGYENLHKFYPPDILPKEFGGNRGPLSCRFYKDKFLNFITQLKAEAQEKNSTNKHNHSN